MKILLAVDTSGRDGSLALAAIREQGRVGVLEVALLAGGTFSAQLVPQIAVLLEKHNLIKRDLEAFAVASGPGSFTGLRVGLAAIKALSEALGKPVVAISLLEAVACGGSVQGRVLAALDAGRTDVYAGDYELGPRPRMRSERLLSREEFLAEAKIAAAAGNVIVTPDPTLADALRSAGIEVRQIESPNAADIARLGYEHLQLGQTTPPEDLEANYIRRTDAEIFAKPPR
jgi:tRNA threonylcarbamoyladenosine biosynthesis protein TsaB